MAFSPISFLLGLGAAWALPALSRVIRPLAVEAAAAGMGMFDEARRLLAEQVETLEDIAAEARARRETIIGAANLDLHGTGNGDAPESSEDPSLVARGRRRGDGSTRRRVS